MIGVPSTVDSFYRPCPKCLFPCGRGTTGHGCFVRGKAAGRTFARWRRSWSRPYDAKAWAAFQKRST